MYSVVLMLALSGGAEATEARCCGCTGYVSSCCGRTHHNRCHGCTGYSRCHGCSGFSRCHGCHGGGYSFTCTGCSGYSSCYGCSGCSGCHGRRGHGHRNRCCGCTGYVVACCGTTVVPGVGAPIGTPPPPAKMPPAVPPPPPAKTDASAPATIVVVLPADARLSVDGNATTSTSDRRVLVTPSLEQGEYVYSLRAEVVRNGQTVAQTQNVTVRPGQTTEVPFSFATEGVASR
jgi:uncharacterized protein (TIGR03000 family)